MFHIPKNLKPLLLRVRLPKIPVVGKAIFLRFGCFTTKYLKMVSQAKVRKTLYVLVKLVLKRGSR
ncbi:hypothetical protein KSS87_006047 [Heliosperma pusillum]|nr:hypothetical protein KSS87_006047 [Heliosperma pusillum]